MNLNSSYVFFRIIEDESPIGAQGIALTPMRSIAIDDDYIPYGVPIWLDVNINASKQKLRQLFIAQDTGGAIKGPVRGDIFFGYGKDAEIYAGHQNSEGSYYILLPRNITVPES